MVLCDYLTVEYKYSKNWAIREMRDYIKESSKSFLSLSFMQDDTLAILQSVYFARYFTKNF